MWEKLPRWAKALIVIAGLWVIYRILLIWFPDPMYNLMSMFGLGSGALMLASAHKSLRADEKKEIEEDKELLKEDRTAIESHKEAIGLLTQQMQAIPLSVDQELKDEYEALAETKRQIAEQEMTDDEAVAFLRQRLKAKRGETD